MAVVLIAEEHILTGKGMKEIIVNRLLFRSVHMVASCSEVLSELRKRAYTHLILDMVLRDGICLEILPTIRMLYPNLKIMVVSAMGLDIYKRVLFAQKVHFFLEKGMNELVTLKKLDDFLNNRITPAKDEPEVASHPFSSLSLREFEVLHYMLSGYSTNKIATVLNLCANTVSTYRTRIHEKTGANNIVDLIRLSDTYFGGRFPGNSG